MTTRPRRRGTTEPALQLESGPSHTAFIHGKDSSQVTFDTILPWMAGFEKRFHPLEHETDVVKCVCNFSCPDEEEIREMVQCDQCGNWQHIPCLKIPRENIPADYFCHLCLPGNHKHLFKAKATNITGATTTTPKSSKRTRPVPEKRLTIQPKRTHILSRSRVTRGVVVYTDQLSSSVDLDLDRDLEKIREQTPDQISNDTSSMSTTAQISQGTVELNAGKDSIILATKAIISIPERNLELRADRISPEFGEMDTASSSTSAESALNYKSINRINFPISKVVSLAKDKKLK